jgi:CRISPR-associated endonuclease/helicase Cas3
MTFARLLAKSSKTPDSPREAETLPGHLNSVLTAAETMLQVAGSNLLFSTGLSRSVSESELRLTLLLAAVLHDLGKANSHFQEAVLHGTTQALRHDWLSAWLLAGNADLNRWLFNELPGHCRNAVIAAVLGHHLKLKDGSDLTWRPGNAKPLTVLTSHADFAACLELARNGLGLDEPPKLSPVTLANTDNRPLAALKDWLLDLPDTQETQSRFVALIKALLISADAVGSALPRQNTDVATWVTKVLSRVCSADDLHGIAQTRLGSNQPREFQRQVAGAANRVAFVRAGCGTGKTVAAYLWAASHGAGHKVFFCYPTTGTATEGFRDYVHNSASSREAVLLHSRSEADLERILEDSTEDVTHQAARFDSLAAWDRQMFVCTADAVLGIIQNNYRPLCALPALVNAAFVFDEIHLYNDAMFGALLRFLDAFRGTSILLMTASLPATRLRAIEETLVDAGSELHTVHGPPELEAIQRYEIARPRTHAPWPEVDEVLGRCGKVLWVANTVRRATDFAKQAESRRPVLYHSRFRYADRLAKHEAVMDGFGNTGGVLAITTQVCEVSLDISADLLVTDLAPIPSLIQRMGRLNRRARPEPGMAIVIEPPTPLPYSEDEFAGAREWVGFLAGGPRSQADLAAAFQRLAPELPADACESAWLDGWFRSSPASLRGLENTIAVIREEDRPQCVTDGGRPNLKAITRLSIPMPIGPVAAELNQWERLGPALVAPVGRIDYSEQWGGTWAKPKK